MPFMVPEAEAHYSESMHTHSNTGQFTIEYLSISEFVTTSGESKVRYNPTGSFNFDDFFDTNNVSSCLSVQVLKPDGTEASITYDTACVQHFAYNYNFEGYINDAFNASGWTMNICNTNLPTGYSVCVEQNFTINFAFLDPVAADTTPATIAATAYLNATSPTGRTLHVQGSGFSLDAYQAMTQDDGVRVILSSITKAEITVRY